MALSPSWHFEQAIARYSQFLCKAPQIADCVEPIDSERAIQQKIDKLFITTTAEKEGRTCDILGSIFQKSEPNIERLVIQFINVVSKIAYNTLVVK